MWRIVFLGWVRLALGVLGAVALGYQAHRSAGNGMLDYWFSYFTVLSNIMGVVVLLLMGAATLRGSRGVPDMVRGAVVLYLAVTGLIYQVLLSNLPEAELAIPWVNHIQHQLLPVAVVAYWFADPPKQRLKVGHALLWLVFPLAFLAYSLIRGPLVGDWYPYPFLDPGKSGGYGGVAGRCLGITAAFVAVLWLLVRLGNLRHDRLTASRKLPKI
ncbi:hypothetical protein G5C51_22355 [Streptomyces sp. A7024]|uniref:Integral membrane regulator n=1 Tax=Streptomyces coryli TaxID=1128680 RepID=A0A6G4U3H6_9ACTN|nr:Pr6Pr family membrane protein [Streptomyces coryli]NGN66633.1 hypothetical protein [Streptomyces coryli]